MNNYNIYPTLLDGFTAFKNRDYMTETELLARLNRAGAASVEARRGDAFNKLIDRMAQGGVPNLETDPETGDFAYTALSRDNYLFYFPVVVCDRMADIYRQSVQQVLLKGDIMTRYGNVHLYGYADGVFSSVIRDIKTTKQYKVGKYRDGWQAYVYTYCLKQMGGIVTDFVYDVTDFREVYAEHYNAKRLDLRDRISEMEEFIQYIEDKRGMINNPKLFGMETGKEERHD